MKKLAWTALGPLIATGVGQADAQNAGSGLAAKFGARASIEQISLSPDGSKVAVVTAIGGRATVLMVADVEKGGDLKPIAKSSGSPDQLHECHWATDTRLICKTFIVADIGPGNMGFTRVFALNADGSSLKSLSAEGSSRALGVAQNGGSLLDWGGSGDGSALMTHVYIPDATTGTKMTQNHQGLGVDLINITTLSRKPVEGALPNAVDYISDGQGNVRIMALRSLSGTGYNSNRISYSYRLPDNRSWKPLTTVTVDSGIYKGFLPSAVDPKLNLAYGYENKDGRIGLYSMALDGSLTEQLVFERPDVDVDDLIEIGRTNRVVGVTYVTDKRRAEFFDPDLKKLRLALAKALPGQSITFVDASADESKLLLLANSDVDPGRYYLFDRKTHGLSEVLPIRPELASVKLAPVQAVTYPAADGTQIPAYLTLPVGGSGKNLPAIVMPHGGPGARDEWGFDWLAQFFAARGFAVIQPNFRGSAGYGDAWYQKNGFQSWRTAIGDVNDAGRWLVKSGVADPDKLAIVGWSYGGYAALQSSVLDPSLFKAIVAIAPVTDLDTLRNESQNFTNFPQVDAFIGHGPWVAEGSPARNVKLIKAPILLFHGDRDLNVGIGESRLMVARMKDTGGQAELVEFKGLDHQLDDSAARTTMLAKADAFLRSSMGMAP